MLSRKTLCAFSLMLLTAALAHAQSNRSEGGGQLKSIVQTAFKATRCPGLSVAVAKANKIIYSGAFGFSDLDKKVPLQIDSVHRLASLSKPVTATIIMDLVQSGRLKLAAPIKTYLPELPAAYDKVTLRHLLSHQAGVRDYRNLDEVFSVIHYSTSRQAIEAFVNDPLLFEPGAKTAYSTFGFTMLGAVAEAVTGESFQNLARDFFRRYKIRGFDLDNPLTPTRRRVHGYSVDKNGKVANSRAYDASNKYPAGGFTASATDYLRFVISVASGKVLNADVLAEMWTAQQTSDGTRSSYGLGWGVSEKGGKKMVGFNGLQPSTTTSFVYFIAQGVGAVMLCNAEMATLDGEGDEDLTEPRDDLVKTVLLEKPSEGDKSR